MEKGYIHEQHTAHPMLYHLIFCPKRPFTAAVESSVQRALSKESGQRFPYIQAFATALEQASTTGDATVIASPPHLPRPSAPPTFSRRRILTGLGLAGLAVTGVEAFFWFSKGTPSATPVVHKQAYALPKLDDVEAVDHHEHLWQLLSQGLEVRRVHVDHCYLNLIFV